MRSRYSSLRGRQAMASHFVANAVKPPSLGALQSNGSWS
jgi:hypothetical protein